MEKDETKDKNTTTPKKEIDPISARLDKMENEMKSTIEEQAKTIEEQAEAIRELQKRPSMINDEDEGILVDRQSANKMSLPVVGDVPVIAGYLEPVVGIPGLEYLMCVTTADGKKYKFPIGCDIKRLDFNDERLAGVERTTYETIKTVKFELQDIDENDLTGASKVQKGQVVAEGGLVAQVDRSSGEPRLTGKKIRTVVRRDIRHYTIEYKGKKITLSSEELGNFRI